MAELEVLTYGIDGTEKFVSFRLDSARNRLLKFDVIATASATALGVGQLVSGIFGMNLPTSLFDPDVAGDDTTFVAVAGGTVGVVLLLVILLLLVFYSPLMAWLSLYCCCADDEMSSLSATIRATPPPEKVAAAAAVVAAQQQDKAGPWDSMKEPAPAAAPSAAASENGSRRPSSRSVTPPVGLAYVDLVNGSANGK